jgi:hypothetical protein
MRRVLAAALLVAVFILNPPVGVVAAFLYLSRRHVAAYAALWRRLLNCEFTTPLITFGGFLAGMLSPYSGVAKALLISIGAVSLYLAPVAPRTSRAASLALIGLAVEAPLKPLVVAAASAAAVAAYRSSACGYICQKASALPFGELAYIPAVGVFCVFEKGGRDLWSVVLQIGRRYVKCVYGICRSVDKEDFQKAVGTVDGYLPEPSAEDFRGVIHMAAPPQAAVKILGKYFDAVVVVGDVEAPQSRLMSVTMARPEVAAQVFGAVFRLSSEQAALLRDLLARGSREEVLAWALRYPWLRPVAELWEDGGEPMGVVKSALPGSLGVVESLLYAHVKSAPVLTDRGDVAALAESLGLTAFLLSGTPRGNFVAVGPARLETPEGVVEVGPGRFLAHLGGMYFAGNF